MFSERIINGLSTLLLLQGRLIRLNPERTTIFVGDTHGDLDATERVFERFLDRERTIVFLGDAVDRGSHSAENLKLILETKLDHPEAVYLLMGNHEAFGALPFSPADFWDRLEPEEEGPLSRLLLELPFAASDPRGILGLHGALPEASNVEEIERIEIGTDGWKAITWGDWSEGEIPDPGISLRPSYDRYDFERRATSLGIKVLVRSHQPTAPIYMFDDRCLTIFTSSAYGRGDRSVAILHPDRRIETARDLELVEI